MMHPFLAFALSAFLGVICVKIIKREVGKMTGDHPIGEQKLLFWWLSGALPLVMDNRFLVASAAFLFSWGLYAWLFLLAGMDSSCMAFSNRVFYGLAVLLFALSLRITKIVLLERLIAYLIIRLMFWGMTFLFRKFRQQEGIGNGDIAIFSWLGLMFGLNVTVMMILLSTILALLFSRSERFAFVPYIAAGTMIVFYFLCPFLN